MTELHVKDAGLVKRLWISMSLVNEIQKILNSKRSSDKTVRRIKEAYREKGL